MTVCVVSQMFWTDFKRTVTIFNSCTKCVGGSGITYDHVPDGHGRMDDLTIERSFDTQTTLVTGSAYFL